MKKQPTSAMCFVCGRNNPSGLHLHFFADEENRVYAEFTPQAPQQGFPGVMHGGLIAAIFDEAIGRTAIANDFWCVTAELTVRYRKPIALGEPLRVMGEMTKMRARVLHGRGEIRRVRDNTLLAEADGVYIRIRDNERREVENNALLDWRVEDA